MKLDDWKARLREPIFVTGGSAVPGRPVVVVDGPTSWSASASFGSPPSPLMIFVKPESLLAGAGTLGSFHDFLPLVTTEFATMRTIGHSDPRIQIESDRDLMSGSVSLRFLVHNEGRNTMLLPAKFRRRNDGDGEYPTIELILRPYREPRFLGLLGESVEVVQDKVLAAWAREDAIQFGAWPEGSKVTHVRSIIGLECRIESPEGARAAFTIRIDGEALTAPIPPYLGATLNLDEAVFLGR